MRKILGASAALVLAATVVLAVRGFTAYAVPFPHAVHKDAGLECGACHTAVATATNLKTSLLPSSEVCTQCHEQPDLEKWGYAKIAPRHSGFRTFSHAAHLGAGLDCATCHPAMENAVGTVERPAAGHEVCFRCHDGAQQTNECRDCHTDLREGRLQGFQRDPSVMKPMSHHPGFLREHEFQVRLEGKRCEECHRSEDFCSTCHQGTNVEVLVHERNFLFTHPVAARKDLFSCRSCHDDREFCEPCHAAQGVVPVSHLHNWANAGAGPEQNRHSIEARRNVGMCASCHEIEGDVLCSRCHRDDGVRGNQPRLDIHPSGFASNAGHGYWHDDPQAACFSCHTRTGVPGQGFCGYCHGEK